MVVIDYWSESAVVEFGEWPLASCTFSSLLHLKCFVTLEVNSE